MGTINKADEVISLNELSNLLKKSADIQIKTKVKTFFDVSGYPHYENVLSNILAFFFDVTEEHGLKDLWLKSLFECYNEKANSNIQLGEFEEIEREHSTDEKKRLDIIISMDNSIVAIENKINASVYNPFGLYHEEVLNYSKDDGKENKQIVEILLSIKPEENQLSFYNITYESLIEKIKKNLGDYIENANDKWFVFMKDVLNNIENLGEKDSMNEEWQKFLKEHGENLLKFFENYSNDIQAKINFINELAHRIENGLIDNNFNLKHGTYNSKNSESFKGYFSLYIDIPKGEDTIVIEPYISRKNPVDLVLELWNRENTKYEWSREFGLFNKEFPNAAIVDDGSWGKCLRLEKFDFEKGVSLDSMVEMIVGLINQLIQLQ